MKNSVIIYTFLAGLILGGVIIHQLEKTRPGCDLDTCTMVWETLNC